MKYKDRHIVIFVVLGILVNLVGKYIANAWNLPLWLDSFGTVFTAYMFGPVSGAAVGLSANLIFGMYSRSSYIYGLTNIVIGVIVGISARKGRFRTVFGTMTVSTLVTMASVGISTPLNILFYEGMTGNSWGDGVIGYLIEVGVNPWLSYLLGEFYVDFLDKVLTLLLLFLCVHLRRRIRKDKKKGAATEMLVLALVTAYVSLCLPFTVYAGGQQSILKKEKAETGGGALTNEDASEEETNFYSYVQTVYSSDNGLPCGEANDVVETNDGVLWIGTYAGLYRYNGSEFRLMSNYNSVKNVNCLYADQEGRLWIGTNDNGLSVSIGESISNVLDVEDGLPANSIRSITQGADGSYYIGTTDALQIIELNGGLRMSARIPEIVYAHSLAASDTGYVAAVTSSGVLFVMKDQEVVASMEPKPGQDIYTCCQFGADGCLYVGTSGNILYVYDVSDGNWVRKATYTCEGLKQINSLYFTEQGQLFVCSDSGVGCFHHDGNYTKINMRSFDNSIDHMTVDYQGNLWFTSSRLGLLRMCKTSFVNVYGSADLSQRVVNTMTLWQEQLYVGTDTGLQVIDPAKQKQVENALTEELDGVRIRCIRTDSKDHLWICTYGRGLLEVTPGGSITAYNSSEREYCDWVRVALETNDGVIISAGDKGLAFIQNSRVEQLIPYGADFCNAMVLCLLEGSDGTIYAGTDGDGIVVLRDGKILKRLTNEDGLSSSVILRITEASNQQGYFIVTSNGLCFMEKNGQIRSLENFPYFNNYDVWHAENGKLFVLSSAGIYVVNETELISGNEPLSYELLNAKRGLNAALTANSWNYLDTEGQLYLSCDTGVYMVDLENYSSGQRTYRMRVAKIELDSVNYRVERGATFSIPRDTTKITIYPEVINYTVDDPYVSYQLVGYEPQENVVLRSELSAITYTNLPSGEYEFRLEVLDNEKQVLEQSSYILSKELEKYDNWWFKLYMLIVAGITIAWMTWFIARTQIQRTLNFQRKELEFARQQVKMGNETILAIAKTVDAKDENTSQHSQRVSDYSVLIAKELGFDDKECENLRKAALLHDIGKIGIPDRILNKPERLTDEEYAVMKTHVTRGAEILKDFTVVEHVVDGALYHHERYDGKGYMHGLKGEEIPIYGRIIGVADAFDAMTQNRVYRKKLDLDFVLGELERCKGTQFDPEIADIMLKLVREGKIILDKEPPVEKKEQNAEVEGQVGEWKEEQQAEVKEKSSKDYKESKQKKQEQSNKKNNKQSYSQNKKQKNSQNNKQKHKQKKHSEGGDIR